MNSLLLLPMPRVLLTCSGLQVGSCSCPLGINHSPDLGRWGGVQGVGRVMPPAGPLGLGSRGLALKQKQTQGCVAWLLSWAGSCLPSQNLGHLHLCVNASPHPLHSLLQELVSCCSGRPGMSTSWTGQELLPHHGGQRRPLSYWNRWQLPPFGSRATCRAFLLSIHFSISILELSREQL